MACMEALDAIKPENKGKHAALCLGSTPLLPLSQS